MSRGRLIHVMGTQSNAGKSTVAMALCRIYSNMGYRVSPFKAMNMSLNSVATADGSEISRSQWLQAKAARIEPDWRINPILLKPEGQGSSQVIFRGKSLGSKTIDDYGDFMRMNAREIVKKTLDELLGEYDIVVAEGSGSAAEVNLFDRDLSNTWLSKECGGTGILVGNIQNGGVFASIVGTNELSQYPEVFKYFIINNMFGRTDLLKTGIEFVEKRTNMECMGIIQHTQINLPGEDSMDYRNDFGGNVGIIAYPFFENYSDIDPLRLMGVGKYVRKPEDLKGIRSLIMPGSKNVQSDLNFLRETKLDIAIIEFNRRKGKILGICGGYQMLSSRISDPQRVQLTESFIEGLHILDADFTYTSDKTVKQIQFIGRLEDQKIEGEGYEIHYGEVDRNGETNIFKNGNPVSSLNDRGNVLGTNVHGLLQNNQILKWLTGKDLPADYMTMMDKSIEDLSCHLLAMLKRDHIIALADGIQST